MEGYYTLDIVDDLFEPDSPVSSSGLDYKVNTVLDQYAKYGTGYSTNTDDGREPKTILVDTGFLPDYSDVREEDVLNKYDMIAGVINDFLELEMNAKLINEKKQYVDGSIKI